MLIEKNRVVSFHYELHEHEGELLETSQDAQPVLYLHGHRGLMAPVTEALEGKSAGDQVAVVVPPERGYGQYQENRMQRVPIKHVLTQRKGKINRGDIVAINTAEGERKATVVKVGKFNVDVDTNHPFAGKTLEFTIDIVSVREASEEELAHGHAHGPGGHQHD